LHWHALHSSTTGGPLSKPGAERFSATKATVDKDIFLDEDGFTSTTINMMAAINNKVLNEQNVYQSTLGAINTTPVFIS
jgi:hypothetical protein